VLNSKGLTKGRWGAAEIKGGFSYSHGGGKDNQRYVMNFDGNRKHNHWIFHYEKQKQYWN